MVVYVFIALDIAGWLFYAKDAMNISAPSLLTVNIALFF